jgi:hypothetical protein
MPLYFLITYSSLFLIIYRLFSFSVKLEDVLSITNMLCFLPFYPFLLEIFLLLIATMVLIFKIRFPKYQHKLFLQLMYHSFRLLFSFLLPLLFFISTILFFLVSLPPVELILLFLDFVFLLFYFVFYYSSFLNALFLFFLYLYPFIYYPIKKLRHWNFLSFQSWKISFTASFVFFYIFIFFISQYFISIFVIYYIRYISVFI